MKQRCMKNRDDWDFGDYAIIEMYRYGAPNEMYLHKVIQPLSSNSWVLSPVRGVVKETINGEVSPVCRCACCGICENRVEKYLVADLMCACPECSNFGNFTGSQPTKASDDD